MEPLDHFGFLLRDAARLLAKNFERRAMDEELGLTLEQCRVLVYLEKNQGISQAQLAYLTETDPMTLVRTLDRIEENGWVERRQDPDDRRVWRLHLTRRAQPILKRIWTIADEARDDALAGFNKTQIAQMQQMLSEVHNNLAALVPNANVIQNSSPRKETTVDKGSSGVASQAATPHTKAISKSASVKSRAIKSRRKI